MTELQVLSKSRGVPSESYSFSTESGQPYSDVVLVVQHSCTVTEEDEYLTVDNMNFFFNHKLEEKLGEVIPILNEAFYSLLRDRDALGYELAHELGEMSTDELQELLEKLVPKPSKPELGDLARKIQVFITLTDIIPSAELAASMFNCEVQDGEQALQALSKETDR